MGKLAKIEVKIADGVLSVNGDADILGLIARESSKSKNKVDDGIVNLLKLVKDKLDVVILVAESKE